MTVTATSANESSTKRKKLEDLPAIGPAVRRAKEAAEAFQPEPHDSPGARVGKRLVQGSLVTGATGVAIMIVF